MLFSFNVRLIYRCKRDQRYCTWGKQTWTDFSKRLNSRLLYLLFMEINKVLSLQFCWYYINCMKQGERKNKLKIPRVTQYGKFILSLYNATVYLYCSNKQIDLVLFQFILPISHWNFCFFPPSSFAF